MGKTQNNKYRDTETSDGQNMQKYKCYRISEIFC